MRDVLYVLYGGEVTVKSFDRLTRVYQLVSDLEIDSLKESIAGQIEKGLELGGLNLLELLEFSMKFQVLTGQVKGLVLANDLEIMRDPMFSMELNKLSNKNFNSILQEYYAQSDPALEQPKLYISDILSDYFHINKIKPEEYF